jgi:hypothetical protein
MIPVVPSSLLLDCFVLARSIRELDMRASPYDLSDLGYAPVRIETPAGKAEYVAGQREFARAGQLLRHRLLAVLADLQPVGQVSDRGRAPGNSVRGTTPHRP